MSDDQKPTINVTRGKRTGRTNRSSGAQSSSFKLPGPMEMASGLIRSARNLWWAGLGAFSVAEEAGSQVFNALVEEGKSWEQAQRERTEATYERVQVLRQEGARAVEVAEERVRDGVRRTLHRVGVPHREDVHKLRDEIDDLSEKVDRLAEVVAQEREEEGA